jgi:hypothetical protein
MTLAKTILLLILSNVFMTFAWYAHLKNLRTAPLIIAILVSWGIAFFEYVIQVPANRIGYTSLSLPQLKILQEIITLAVFVPFALIYMKASLSWNHLFAALCLVGAAYFIFKPQ